MSRLRRSGGYRELRTFQTTTLIYDATYWFCETFMSHRSRTVDQMIQAARSGRQNIAEGSRASATSTYSELKLINVARASLEELLLDFEDFLRHNHLAQWTVDSADSRAVRRIARLIEKDRSDRSDPTDQTDRDRWQFYAGWLEHAEAATRANAIICLIHQANYLLDRQIDTLEASFVQHGGYREQLAAARLETRRIVRRGETDKAITEPRSTESLPDCPKCGSEMVFRTASKGAKAGKQFLGCSRYPDCTATLPI